jgi:hypothetical protein
MNKERTYLIGVGAVYMVVVATVAYFDYHLYVGLGAAVAGFLLATVLLSTVLLSAIPFAGIFVQIVASMKLIERWSRITGLPTDTLAVAVAFWPIIMAGAAVCFVSTLLLLIRF